MVRVFIILPMPANYRDIPTRVCPCGSDLFRLIVHFDENYEIAMYLLEAECVECDSLITAPTPLDLPQIAGLGEPEDLGS